MSLGFDVRTMFDEYKSVFMYYQGCEKVPTVKNVPGGDSYKIIKTLNKMEVTSLYDSKLFTDSDLHIVKIVANNLFATQKMIEKAIFLNNARSNESTYVPMIADLEFLKSRLTDLVKANILIKYIFQVPRSDNSGNYINLSYYLTSPHGYNFIKRILNFDKNYDEYLAVTPIEEVFHYLSTGSVCQEFMKLSGVTYEVDMPFYSKNTKKLNKLYGKISMNKDGVEYRIVVEPLKFLFNRNRISEDDFIRNLNTRFLIVKEYLQTLLAKADKKFYLIFVCDDYAGLRNACILADRNLKEYMPYIYFTTDKLCSRGLDEALIQIKDGIFICNKPEFL